MQSQKLLTGQGKTSARQRSPLPETSGASRNPKSGVQRQSQVSLRHSGMQQNSKSSSNLFKAAKTTFKNTNFMVDDSNVSRTSLPGRKKNTVSSTSFGGSKMPTSMTKLSDSVVIRSNSPRKEPHNPTQFNQMRFTALQPPSLQSLTESKHVNYPSKQQRSAEQTLIPTTSLPMKNGLSESPSKIQKATYPHFKPSSGRVLQTNGGNPTPRLMKSKPNLQKQVIGVVKANQMKYGEITNNVQTQQLRKFPPSKAATTAPLSSKNSKTQGKKMTMLKHQEVQLQVKKPDQPVPDIDEQPVREIYNNLAMQAFAQMEKRIYQDANMRRSMMSLQNQRSITGATGSSFANYGMTKMSSESKLGGRPSLLGEPNTSVTAKMGDCDDEIILGNKTPEHEEIDFPQVLPSQRRHAVDTTRSMLSAYQNSINPNMSKRKVGSPATEVHSLDTTILQNIQDIQAPSSGIMALKAEQTETSEENLLEQTLGQTLTQQKDILDQINQETQQRNHMQLMSKLMGEESKPSSLHLSGSQRVTPRRGSVTSSSIMTSWMPTSKGNLTNDNSLVKIVPIKKAEFGIPKIMQKQDSLSLPITMTVNSPHTQSNIGQIDKSSNASKPPTTKTLQGAKKPINVVKANTTHTSPRFNVGKEEDRDSNSGSDYAVLEKTLTHHIIPDITTHKNSKSTVTQAQQIRVAAMHKKQPSTMSQNAILSMQASAAPGQVMSQLKDRRSMSRIETGQPSQPLKRDASVGNNLKSVRSDVMGLKGLNRDLSMPRLTAKTAKPAEELIPLVTMPVPRAQQKISQKGSLLYEFNVRLSNLLSLHGSSFLTPQYQSLRVIDIRNNRITELPGEICSLTQITHLKLDYNYLQALPFSLGSVRSLVFISSSQNRLQALPDSLFHKESQMQQLFVNDNRIRELPRGLGKLVHLKTLYLHNNVLVEVPTSLSQLSNLVEFSLDWFLYIEQEEIALSGMQSLKEVSETPEEQLNSERVTMAMPNEQKSRQNMQDLTRRSAERTNNRVGIDDTRKTTQVEAVNNRGISSAPQGNRKVLKGEKGAAMINEFKLFVKLFDSAQRQMRSERGLTAAYRSITSNATQTENIQTGASGFVHFLQFLMYFYKIEALRDVKNLQYKHKKRHLIHMLAVNGHLYLLKTSIAVLGINRPLTSLDLNAPDEDNSTALLLSMKQKRFEFVKYLLRLPQTKTSVYSIKYGLPMHVALAQAEFKLASKIIKTYFMENSQTDSTFEVDVNVPNEYGNTALHLIFLNFSKAPEKATMLAKLVIKKGADLQAKNQHQLGVLHLAVQSNNMAAMEFSLSHNKKVRARRLYRIKEAKEFQDYELFDFDMRGGKQQWSVLHHAIYHTNLPMITLLLQCGESIDLQALDSTGRRAIDLCPYSSPIFKSIRHKTRDQIRKQTVKLFEEQKKSKSKNYMNERLNHAILSARECAIMTPERHQILTLQSLFMLKQLPADQLRQDVPPGPGPFPQKMLNYNSNTMITEHQGGVLQSTMGAGAAGAALAIPTDSFVDGDDEIDLVSDYHVFIPNALLESEINEQKSAAVDASMNVPFSFDMRAGASNTEKAANRLTSHHLQIGGVTNINKNDFASNPLLETTVAGGPISSVKDEDALNKHWQELLGQEAPKPSARDRQRGRNDVGCQPYDYLNNQETLYSISETDLLAANNGQKDAAAPGLMIYSTLAAAYPYELEVSRFDHRQNISAFVNNEETKVIKSSRSAVQTTQEDRVRLDLPSVNTAVNQGNKQNEEGEEDSADNMDDVDEQTVDHQPQKLPLHAHADLAIETKDIEEDSEHSQPMVLQASDGENVEMEDEDETQTKAFEARESQWNRKLSIKHSEEKRLRQIKSSLSEAIVRSFEEARNYHAQNLQVSPQPSLVINNQEFAINVTLPIKNHQIETEEVLNNDQDEIMKPLRSSNIGNSHQLGMGSSPIISRKATDNIVMPSGKNYIIESPPDQKVQMIPRSNKKNNRQQSSFNQYESKLLQTHNLNLMSTVKVTDLKLHLQPSLLQDVNLAEPGLAAKIASQERAPEELIENLLAQTCISGNDMAVLVWAREVSTLKLQESARQILHFIQLVVASSLTLGAAFGNHEVKSNNSKVQEMMRLPTLARLILNLHELDNMYAMKSNEFNQKQSMKFIIINSTGRHRKAPSEFQSAKTIKRHEMPSQQFIQSRKSMDRTRSLLGPMVNDPSRVLQKQERKNYREEDSLLMYDSNMTQLSLRNVTVQQLQQTRPLTSHEERHSLIKSHLGQSNSTQNLGGQRHQSSPAKPEAVIPLDSLIARVSGEFEDHLNDEGTSEAPPTKSIHVSASSSSLIRRRNSPIRAGKSASIKQLLHKRQAALQSRMNNMDNLSGKSSPIRDHHSRALREQNKRDGLSRSYRDGRNNTSNSLDRNRVGLEGHAQLAFEYKKAELTGYQPNQKLRDQITFGEHAASMPTLRVYDPPTRPSINRDDKKKGVTSGMKLVQPEKKIDDFNLDLTILIDQNEELRLHNENRIEHRQSRRTAIFGSANMAADISISPSAVFVDVNDLRPADGIFSPPNLEMEEHMPIKTRMIGDIQQFNELLEASQDNLARRVSGRQKRQTKPGMGIGMHLRQKDPLGSIVLSTSQDSSLHQRLQQSVSASSSQHEPKH